MRSPNESRSSLFELSKSSELNETRGLLFLCFSLRLEGGGRVVPCLFELSIGRVELGSFEFNLPGAVFER